MELSCAEFTVEYLRPFEERTVSTAATSLEIVPIPLNSSTGTAVVVFATAVAAPLDVASVELASLDPLVEVVVVVPLVVDPVVVVAVVVVDAVPELLAPVLVDPLGVDVVVPEVGVEVGSGTGPALAGVPSVEPGVPHAVKIIGTTAISPKTIARCNLLPERGNETTTAS
jgi:hypothetical protein